MKRLVLPRLYVILDASLLNQAQTKQSEKECAQNLLAAGVTLLQHRDKQASARELLEKSCAISELARERNALFFVNDRPDVAYLAGADGVHVGQHDLHCKQARAVIGPEKFVGVSTHNLEQFTDAAATSADYIAIGPIFETRTKANPDPVVGAELVRRARALTDKPIVAIGGITLERSAEIIAAGADSVAVISDILLAPDPAERAAKFIVHLDGLPQRNDPNKSPSSPATDADVRLS
ncbi:MAG: thiamine phosphate synthase [Candidatus Acidiferrum sp.]